MEQGARPDDDGQATIRLPVADAEFTLRVPLAVAGAGAAGLSAALAARDRGIAVLVLERDAVPAGTTAMSLGAMCAAGSGTQRAAGVRDSAAALCRDILAMTRDRTDADLAAHFAEMSGPTIDWLVDDHGITLELDRDWVGLGHTAARLHAPPDREGETLMASLLHACARSGADILTSATVEAVFTDDNGRTCGVRLRRPDGSREDLRCDALILATGGFAANRTLVARHIAEMRAAESYCHEGSDGTALTLGTALGAETADLGAYQGYGLLAHPHRLLIPHTLLLKGGILVNGAGRRFTDESTNVSYKAVDVLGQDGGVAWCVYDDACHRFALRTSADYREAERHGAIFRGAGVEALAGVAGIDAAGLARTLRETTENSRAGHADEFGRTLSRALSRDDLLALRVTGALFHTQGGLAVDKEARVRGRDGKPVPALFAAGGAARGLSGPGGWGYLPGMGLATAVTFGRLAGMSAASSV